MSWLVVLALALAVVSLPSHGRADEGAAAAAEPGPVGKFSGPLRATETLSGLPVKINGRIHLTVDRLGGSFTCRFTATTNFSGPMVIEGKSMTSKGSGTARSTSCSGSYSPVDGTIEGRYELTESIKVTLSVVDDKGKKLSKTLSHSAGDVGAIKGVVTSKGAIGYLQDDGDGPAKRARWRASGGFPPEAHKVDAEEQAAAKAAAEAAAKAEAAKRRAAERQREQAREKRKKGRPLSEILAEVDDPEMRAAIAAEFRAYKRETGEQDRKKLEAELRKLRTKHYLVDDLDRTARMLDRKQGQHLSPGEAAEVAELVSRVWRWSKGRDSAEIREALGRFSAGMRELSPVRKKALEDTADKAAKTQAEVQRVKRRIEAIERRLAKGEIDAQSARTLKGMVMLGGGMEYVTSWSSPKKPRNETDFGRGIRRLFNASERNRAVLGDCCEDGASKCCSDKVERDIITGF